MRVAASRCLDQQLAHRAGRDALEVQTRGGCYTGLLRQFQPRLIDQSRGAQRAARISALDARSQPAQLLVGQAEELVESFSFLRCLIQLSPPEPRCAKRIS